MSIGIPEWGVANIFSFASGVTRGRYELLLELSIKANEYVDKKALEDGDPTYRFLCDGSDEYLEGLITKLKKEKENE